MKFAVLALLGLTTVGAIRINVPAEDEDQFLLNEDNEEFTQTDAESNAAIYPANVLDLSNWKFQTPDGKSSGGVTEISQPALANYSSNYLYTDGNAVYFSTPLNGSTTEGSEHPRSELRELKSTGDWTFSGVHTMKGTTKMVSWPSNDSYVCFA
jgi:hypothetical protein